MREDGGLLLQLLQIDTIVDAAEAAQAREDGTMIDGEEVLNGGGW